MRIGFIVTSPYQLFHFKRIHEHFAEATVFVEVREREFGVTDDLARKHLPGADIVWVPSHKLGTIDGKCDVLVCQTPVPLMHFYSKSQVVAQQYSLAKERYQYGVWRAQANLNLMYGRYSVGCVSGFSNAVAVGKPLLDRAYADGRVPDYPAQASRRPRVLYMPTYGDLSDKEATIRKLLAQNVELSIKFHHAESASALIGGDSSIRNVGSNEDPIDAILEHDVVVSDYSGAIYDALAAGRPVVLCSELNDQSSDLERLSEEDRGRSEIGKLVSTWTDDVPFPEVYEQARTKLADRALVQAFLDRYFVNLGSAGKACASQITMLIENGEPDSFAVKQVRETYRSYILKNRELRAQSKNSVRVARPSMLTLLKSTSPRVIVLKTIRSGLLRTPGGDRVLHTLRRLRGTVRSNDASEPAQLVSDDPWGLPPVPKLRREAMLAVLQEALRAHGVDCRARLTQSNVYCAVRESELDEVHKAITELGAQCPGGLRVWLGKGARYDKHCLAASISLVDIMDSESIVVGVPYVDGLYGVHRHGGAEILILQRRDVRLVARRWRAEEVDWTEAFSEGTETAQPSAERHVLAHEPIDVVYTWVDSGDLEWQAARRAWAAKENVHLQSASNDERFLNRDELRYSLRSVWLYAPFVRNIFIVTAGHRPEWLVNEHERIRIVAHADIFPDAADLPTFNSHAIEACLHRIPGLSENFVYFNDDVFLGRETTVETFFSKAGLIKSRFSPSSFTAATEPDASAIPTDWASYNAVRLIRRDFGLFFDRKMQHVPMPMKRSLLREIEERYSGHMARTRSARFRSQSDLSVPSMLGHYFGIATGRAIEWPGKPGQYVYADTGRHDFESKLKAIARTSPVFLCLNVTRHTDIEIDQQAVLLQQYLQESYPVPSPFEI